MLKFLPALFVIAALAGCDTMQVRYVQVYYPAQTQGRLVMPQAPTGETAAVPAATASTPVAPVVQQEIIILQQPPVYYNPIADIATTYFVWRSLTGGWYSGHHRRGR